MIEILRILALDFLYCEAERQEGRTQRPVSQPHGLTHRDEGDISKRHPGGR